MHKKLEAELASLAHNILEMKNNNDVTTLHKKAQIIYEKLTVLKFVEANINMPFEVKEEEKVTPNFENEELESIMKGVEIKEELNEELDEEVKDEIIEKAVEIEFEVEKIAVVEEETEELDLKTSFEMQVEEEQEEVIEEVIKEATKKPLTPREIEEIFATEEPIIQDDKDVLTKLQFSLEDEFKDAISADVATELFERVTKENPVIQDKATTKPKSLNDSLFSSNLQIGLNDRIAFVKHLFDNSQVDFNRVLSQLNSFKTEEEAKDFIENMVKPDYNWDGKQDYEARLIDLIERKFS